MLNITRIACCCKRFSKQLGVLNLNRIWQKGHVETISSKAAVSLAYDRYKCSSKDMLDTPLLIIHGLFGSKRNWTTFCKAYNGMTGREIIAVDCRNHGESDQSSEMSFHLMCYDIEKTLIQLNIPKAIVIGHSLGGKVAMNMALSMPSYVEKLIVVDVGLASSPSLIDEFCDVIQEMLDINLSRIQSKKEADGILAKIIPSSDIRGFLLTNLRKDNQSKLTWQINLKGLQNNLKRITEGVDLNGRAKYQGETLFVAGGNSDYIGIHDLHSIRAVFPKANLEVVTGAGHLVHTDKPKEFLTVIHEFLA